MSLHTRMYIVSNETLWEENDINILPLSAKDFLRIEINFIRIPDTIQKYKYYAFYRPTAFLKQIIALKR